MKLSIITPTFNRSEFLKKLYESLLNQSNLNFEWIIVDDGSEDSTKKVVSEFITEKFKITYYYKENGGKHTALNIGFELAKYDYIFIVDSDDILTIDAVDSFYKYADFNSDLCGISFLRGYTTNEVIGQKFPKDIQISSYNEMRINNKITGDKAEIWRKDLLLQNKFPVIKNEKFIGEGYVWTQISKKYKMLFVNKIIYICNYLEGGLTKSGRRMRVKNPIGGMMHANLLTTRDFKFSVRIKNTILFNTYGFFAKIKPTKIIKQSNSKYLSFILMPASYLLYIYWEKSTKVKK